MNKQIVVLVILTTILLSCDSEQKANFKFGCDPPCEKKNWLTFSYDCAYLFQDTTGAIKSALQNDSLLNYTRHHNAQRLHAEDVEAINTALSCGLWTCKKTPTKKELYNPENIVVFVQSTVPVGYITICSKSNIVSCKPNSNNKEIAVFSSILKNILRKD